MRTKITGKYVVGFEDGDHVIFEDGEIVYDNDRIVFVGHQFPGEVDVTYEEGLALVGPGFIDLNALGDIDHAVFDSFQDAELGKGLRWSEEYVSRRHASFSAEEQVIVRRYAFRQLLINGITTALPIASEVSTEWAERDDELLAASQVAGELGLRIYLGPSYRSAVPVVRMNGESGLYWDEQQGEKGLAAAIRFVEDVDGSCGGLVRGMLAPSRIETLTPEVVRKSRAASDSLECPVRLHAGQTLEEVGIIRERFGKRPIEFLNDLGFLGPRTLIAHAWAVAGHSQVPEPGDDVAMLADSEATVIFCPMAIARYAVVLESFERYTRRGVRMAMGTDIAPPDMIRALDTGIVLTKAIERRRESGSVGELYRSATIGGADALNRDDLGRLRTGAQADIIVVDFSEPRIGPIDDPIRTLVHACNGRDVRRVVVAGRTVVANHEVLGCDVQSLAEQGQDHLRHYRASYTERDFRHRSEAELFPSTFAIRVRKDAS